MAKGFAATPEPKSTSEKSIDSISRPQIKEVRGDDPCPCTSGSLYFQCCGRFHQSDTGDLPGTVEEAVRARFSAYATGCSGYLVDSTHPLHKDYQRHVASSLNPRKGRRSWEKEIIQQNSEVFEFLNLEIMDAPQASVEFEHADKLGDDVETECIRFRVLVRARGDGTIVPFEEIALFTKHSNQSHAILDFPLSLSKKNKAQSAQNPPASSWLYVKGDVAVMDEDTTRRMVAEAPKYMSSSIRDQW